MTYKRKKYHYGDTHLQKRWRTKRRKKDLDEQRSAFLRPAHETDLQLSSKNNDGVEFSSALSENNGDVPDDSFYGKKYANRIDEDLKEENAKKLLNQEVDFDKPGNAQFYCLHCARYFIDNQALQDHFRTKVHKRRLKALELEPYSIEESERAAGKGSFQEPKKRKIETQPSLDESEKINEIN